MQKFFYSFFTNSLGQTFIGLLIGSAVLLFVAAQSVFMLSKYFQARTHNMNNIDLNEIKSLLPKRVNCPNSLSNAYMAGGAAGSGSVINLENMPDSMLLNSGYCSQSPMTFPAQPVWVQLTDSNTNPIGNYNSSQNVNTLGNWTLRSWCFVQGTTYGLLRCVASQAARVYYPTGSPAGGAPNPSSGGTQVPGTSLSPGGNILPPVPPGAIGSTGASTSTSQQIGSPVYQIDTFTGASYYWSYVNELGVCCTTLDNRNLAGDFMIPSTTTTTTTATTTTQSPPSPVPPPSLPTVNFNPPPSTSQPTTSSTSQPTTSSTTGGGTVLVSTSGSTSNGGNCSNWSVCGQVYGSFCMMQCGQPNGSGSNIQLGTFTTYGYCVASPWTCPVTQYSSQYQDYEALCEVSHKTCPANLAGQDFCSPCLQGAKTQTPPYMPLQ